MNIPRRRALALLTSVPVAMALSPSIPVQAAKSEPWPPKLGKVSVIWHEPLTIDEIGRLNKLADSINGMRQLREAGYRIDVDRWGHSTLTVAYKGMQSLAEMWAEIVLGGFGRRVPYSINWPPVAGPPTLDQYRAAIKSRRGRPS